MCVFTAALNISFLALYIATSLVIFFGICQVLWLNVIKQSRWTTANWRSASEFVLTIVDFLTCDLRALWQYACISAPWSIRCPFRTHNSDAVDVWYPAFGSWRGSCRSKHSRALSARALCCSVSKGIPSSPTGTVKNFLAAMMMRVLVVFYCNCISFLHLSGWYFRSSALNALSISLGCWMHAWSYVIVFMCNAFQGLSSARRM